MASWSRGSRTCKAHKHRRIIASLTRMVASVTRISVIPHRGSEQCMALNAPLTSRRPFLRLGALREPTVTSKISFLAAQCRVIESVRVSSSYPLTNLSTPDISKLLTVLDFTLHSASVPHIQHQAWHISQCLDSGVYSALKIYVLLSRGDATVTPKLCCSAPARWSKEAPYLCVSPRAQSGGAKRRGGCARGRRWNQARSEGSPAPRHGRAPPQPATASRECAALSLSHPSLRHLAIHKPRPTLTSIIMTKKGVTALDLGAVPRPNPFTHTTMQAIFDV